MITLLKIIGIIILLISLWVFVGFALVHSVKNILTYSPFKTPCEVIVEHQRRHAILGQLFLSFTGGPRLYLSILRILEESEIAVGRDVAHKPHNECQCPREYALSFKRPGRKKLKRTPRAWAWWEEKVPRPI